MSIAEDVELRRWVTYMETPLAELEEYGLCPKAISILERRADVIWIKQLQCWQVEDLRKIPNFGRAFEVALLRAMSSYWRSLA